MKLTREFKIGLTALIALALIIWGLNFLKGINILKPTDKYYAVYSDIKGLIKSGVVILNGYKVGNVREIEFDQNRTNRIIVQVSLEQRLKLPKNTKLVIQSSSIISGVKDLKIVLGDGPGYYEPGDTLLSGVEADLSDYLSPIRDKAEKLVASTDTLMKALTILLDENTRRNLQASIANLSSSTASLRQSLSANGSLTTSFNNLAQVSQNLKNNNEAIGNMIKNLSSVSDSLKKSDLKALIEHATETFNLTAQVFENIKNGEGTIGKLMVNDSLYNNLNSSLASLDTLLIDLRENPKRYVHFSVFGKKEK